MLANAGPRIVREMAGVEGKECGSGIVREMALVEGEGVWLRARQWAHDRKQDAIFTKLQPYHYAFNNKFPGPMEGYLYTIIFAL